jgi:hypothetical protein
MTQEPQRPTEVLGALPHRRPHRRSQKRAAVVPSEGEPRRTPGPLRDTAATPAAPHRREIVGTVVQAAAELAEIGLSVSARAFKEAVARLPRP